MVHSTRRAISRDVSLSDVPKRSTGSTGSWYFLDGGISIISRMSNVAIVGRHHGMIIEQVIRCSRRTTTKETMRRYVLLLGVVRFFFVPIQLVASLSLFDRRKVLNTATTTILSSSWSTPANSEWRDPLYTDDSRLWIPIPATKINRISRISIPKIGYSLYNTNPDQAETCVQLAIQAGCRHFDVATQYGSNEQVGRVLRSFVTDGRNGAQKSTYTRQRRQELFISHKVSNEEQSTKIANVKQTIKRQLHQLSVDYLDLCSIHSPLTDPDRRLATYQAILELQQEGIVKAIGVCNYGVHPLSKY